MTEATDPSRLTFAEWLVELDKAYAAAGYPYGHGGSVAEITGTNCWRGNWADGEDAADALADDLDHAD